LSANGLDTRFDDVDLAIVQLLREGMSAREIGQAIELSHRTIEHRVERMKIRAGVKSVVPLLVG
jgi:DNA-binding NarL/FixJ family response regulator